MNNLDKNKAKNSWGGVSKWYNRTVKDQNSFQNKVILPKLISNLSLKKNTKILDLGCGQGMFANKIALISKEDKLNIKVTGVDISSSLVKIASTVSSQNKLNSQFFTKKAQELDNLYLGEFDEIITVLALQNMGKIDEVIKQGYTALNKNGIWHLVINHPCFRQPKKSSWSFDDQKMINYRSLEGYGTFYQAQMDMMPSMDTANPDKVITASYHYSLADLFGVFFDQGFVMTDLDEWYSHIPQDQGPKTQALEVSRAEFPMFMYLKFVKTC
jgi:ubiquinone/menaquinone biosynthesis C-methylase UbiE